MQNTPPCNPLATAVPSCRWPRGRPVSSKSQPPRKPTHPIPALMQYTTSHVGHAGSTAPADKDHDSSASNVHTSSSSGKLPGLAMATAAGQISKLWNASLPLRFAPTTVLYAQPSADAALSASEEEELLEEVKKSVLEDNAGTGIGEGQDDASQKFVPDSQEFFTDLESTSELENEEDSTEEDESEEELEDLSYQIPEERLRAAMLAAENTRGSFYSTALYEGPDGEGLFTHYCKTFEVAERVAKYFLDAKVVGFDIEWRPYGNQTSIKHNASLIQLACENRVALFHVALFAGNTVQQLMPPTLKKVLESPEILKVGVAIKSDFKRLEKYLGVQAQGVFELSRLHNLVEWYNVDQTKVSNRLARLAVMVLQHLQLPLYKGGDMADDPEAMSGVRQSDWSLPLETSQIHYAATDAYAGLRLYYLLEQKRIRLRPKPPAVPVCDYDNQCRPKVRATRKKNTDESKVDEESATDSKDLDPRQTLSTCLAEPQSAVSRKGGENEEDCGGQREAAEALLDSQRLEGATPTVTPNFPHVQNEHNADALLPPTLPEHDAVQRQKRIGRLNFRKGPDPLYPVLPEETVEEDEKFREFSETHKEPSFIHAVSNVDPEAADDDEFADPELEKALQALDVDQYGKLTEMPFDIEDSLQHQVVHPSQSVGNSCAQDEVAHEPPVHSFSEKINVEVNENPPEHTKSPLETLQVQHTPIVNLPHQQPTVSTGATRPTNTAFDLATTWAQHQFKANIPSPSSTAPSHIRATIPHLRSYHLWHHQHLTVDQITRCLRDPPLLETTVINYVLQAISLEKLGYEDRALKDLLMGLPIGMRKARWKVLAERVGALDGA